MFPFIMLRRLKLPPVERRLVIAAFSSSAITLMATISFCVVWYGGFDLGPDALFLRLMTAQIEVRVCFSAHTLIFTMSVPTGGIRNVGLQPPSRCHILLRAILQKPRRAWHRGVERQKKQSLQRALITCVNAPGTHRHTVDTPHTYRGGVDGQQHRIAVTYSYISLFPPQRTVRS